jgi:hypothetical protein
MVTGDNKWFNGMDGEQAFPSLVMTTEHPKAIRSGV